ncbi:hypothetical protein CS063_16815 [Sporanaerobium hydrogeniformans]|uniref:Uncharacterized protein n=1 Tax=Sporanaerobium hydrogeniformans TaxID=3072179 RepID=A0AC61D6B4_9FIRM|nr:hypothetical protein [Sporanaerobium hydrogeniformans]PHV69249.1 hypothetical protein CS063_16815 [Sporanaerobium hydrogeniformans]
MGKYKIPKKLKWKYRTIKIFIVGIATALVASLSFAYLLYIRNNEFGFSTCLNIFGGLTTGLIILAYTYLSNKNLKNVTNIVEMLNELDLLPIYRANELDFCTDANWPSEEQMLDHGIDLDTILEDNEGCVYALLTYKEYLNNLNLQFNKIKDFSEQYLLLPLAFDTYKGELDRAITSFSEYQIEDMYKMPPYLVRKSSNGDIIDIYNNENDAKQYIKEHSGVESDNEYYIDPPGNMYAVSYVFHQGAEISVENVYNEWIDKMNTLYDKIEQFNSDLLKCKKSICDYHDKNINIVH